MEDSAKGKLTHAFIQGYGMLRCVAPATSIQDRVVVQQSHTEGSENQQAIVASSASPDWRNTVAEDPQQQRTVTNSVQAFRSLSTLSLRVSAPVHQRFYAREEQRQYRDHDIALFLNAQDGSVMGGAHFINRGLEIL